MVKNQKIAFYAVLGHLGTPKWTRKGAQRPTNGWGVCSNV
jgi:hypothetical protein